ncbi:hypothetical protein V493_03056 [Pseudogymnoascus sp. VKM F-4281 (FW-2241)]|nr:hypothetical protein V493_03056 [Pseudogymnoascus sp. VKM F-4281 (FW-2241)]
MYTTIVWVAGTEDFPRLIDDSTKTIPCATRALLGATLAVELARPVRTRSYEVGSDSVCTCRPGPCITLAIRVGGDPLHQSKVGVHLVRSTNASLRTHIPPQAPPPHRAVVENGRVPAPSGTSVSRAGPQTESDIVVTLVVCIRRHSVLLSVPLYETAALGQGGNQERFSTSDREYDWECLIAVRGLEKIFALALSDHHIKFPYTDGNDVSFVLWWKEHGPNGIAAKKAAKGKSFTMQSSERPAAIHLLLLFKSQAARIQTLFSNRREGDSPKLLDPTQPNPLGTLLGTPLKTVAACYSYFGPHSAERGQRAKTRGMLDIMSHTMVWRSIQTVVMGWQLRPYPAPFAYCNYGFLRTLVVAL